MAASLLAISVDDPAGRLKPRGADEKIASKPAPTGRAQSGGQVEMRLAFACMLGAIQRLVRQPQHFAQLRIILGP